MSADNQRAGDAGSSAVVSEAIGDAVEVLRDPQNVNWQFFEASPDGVKIIGLDGRLLFVNANGLTALEAADRSELCNRNWLELWPGSSRGEVEAAFRSACQGQGSRFTAPRPTSKGSPRWWDVVISPIKDSHGKVVSVLSISRDVTAGLTLADTLRRSEQQFQALANNMAQLAWLADPAGNVFWFNQRWLDYTGSSLETALGQGWRVFHHPEHIVRVVEKFARCIADGRVWEDLYPLRGADGVYRWFLSRAMPVRNSKGEIELWCGTDTDVTEQRQQSQRLRKLARIIDLSHEAILVREIGEGIVLWNRGCEEMFGYTKAEALGRPSFELLKPRNVPAHEAFDTDILANGGFSGEIQYTASDGSAVWVDSRQELIQAGGRKLVLETSRDITERRQADEIRSLLVAELNHRVMNTLAVVQSIAAQTARTSPTPDKFVASFNGRLQALASAHNILTDVAWAGAPIHDLVRSQISVLGVEIGRVTLTGEPVILPPQTALQLALILHELASNAMQHGALSTPGGRIAITWRIRDDEPRLVELTWTESGGPAVAPPQQRGFGLTLIERSKGLPNLKTSIAFEPAGIVARVGAEAGAGRQGAATDLFNPGRKLTQARPAPQRSLEQTAKRILIIDGSGNPAVFIEDMLDNAGYAVVRPADVPGGKSMEADGQRVDLVALDVDAIDDAEIDRLMAGFEARHVPCIALGSPQRLAQIRAGEFEALVAKPIEPNAFLRAVSVGLAEEDFRNEPLF